jgi:putative nucleotide binding protein
MRGEAGTGEWVMVLTASAPPLVASEQPLIQAMDMTGFRLLAVAVADSSDLSWGDRLYIGPGAWDRVVGIERQLTYQWLTPTVQRVLAPTVAAIIRRNEARFIEVFNTTVLDDLDDHPLALLPGLARDCRESIIDARAQRRFADFGDLIARVPCLDQPQDLLVERVLVELRESEDTYHWLTK